MTDRDASDYWRDLAKRLLALIEYERGDGTTGLLYPGGSAGVHETIREAASALSRLATGGEAPSWRPIKTVPKDGTLVDLWVKYHSRGSRLTDCYWRQIDWYKNNIGWLWEAGFVPTHWMPLPAPPETTDD